MNTASRYALPLLVLVITVLLAMPFTAIGSRALVSIIDGMTALEVRYRGGRLAGALDLQGISLQFDSVTLELDNIQSELDVSCLWQSTVCLKSLQVEALDVEIRSSEGAAASKEPSSEILRFPVPIQIDLARIDAVSVTWPAGSWVQQSMRARLSLQDSTLTLSDAVINEALLALQNSEPEEAAIEEVLALPEIDIPFKLNVEQLTIDTAGALIADQAYELEELGLAGQWQRSKLVVQRLALAHKDIGQLGLAGSIEFQQHWPLIVELDFKPVLSEVLNPIEFDSVAGQLSGDFANLSVDLSLEGNSAAQVFAEVDLLRSELPFSGEVELKGQQSIVLAEFFALPQPLDNLTVVPPLSANFSGDIAGQQFSLSTMLSGVGYQQTVVTAKATLSDSRVALEELSLRQSASGEQLLVSGELSLAEQLSWNLELTTEGFSVPVMGGVRDGTLAGKLNTSGVVKDAKWQLFVKDVNLQGEINGLAAMARGHGGLNQDWRLSDSDFNAQFNGAVLAISGSGAAGDGGQLSLAVDDIGRWKAGGFGSIAAKVERDPASQNFTMTAELSELRWDELSLASGSLNGYYRPAESGVFDLRGTLEEISYGAREFARANLHAKGDEQEQQLRLFSEGDLQGQLLLAGGLNDNGWAGQLAPAVITASMGQWQLDSAVSVSWALESDSLNIGAHCWRHPSLKLCTGDSTLGVTGSTSMEADGELSVLGDFMSPDLRLNGGIRLSVDASWSPSTLPVIEGDIEITDIGVTRHFGLGESVSVTWDRARGVVENRQQGLYFDLALEKSGARVLAADLLLPAQRTDSLAGQVFFQGLRLQALAPWTPNLARMEGILEGELTLAGTIENPQLNGPLALRKGHLAMVGNPTQIEDLVVEMDYLGSGAKFRGAALVGGGDLQLEGSLEREPQWQMALSVSGSRNELLMPPASHIIASPELRLTVTPELVQVAGDVTVHEGELRQDLLPAGSVPLSTDVVEVDLGGEVIREDARFDTALDIWLHLNKRLVVANDSVRATVGGKLHLLQDPGRPRRLFGNLNVTGGQLQAFRQTLQIRRGSVSFSGDPTNPEFDISAQREIRDDNVTVGAQLLGTLEDPTLEVFSDPVMSQSEAMSYLVRGRGLDSGAGADGAALALSVGADIVNQSGLVSELNRLPGISNVSFGATGTEDDTAATVSGYLGERLYLSYGIGVYEPINVLTARFYFSTRLWLEVVSRIENSIDLYYSFDLN